MADTTMTADQVTDEDLQDWTFKDDTLHATFEPDDFSGGARFALQVAAAADAADHHPEVDLRYGEVVIRCSSHDVGGVTERDVKLARRISEIAEQQGFAERDESSSDDED